MYLKDNWLSMQGMWCSAFRRDLLTLGNNTTNRIESFNSQVKRELRKRPGIPPSLPELLGLLLQIVKMKDSDATYKGFRNSATVIMNTRMPDLQPAGEIYNDAGFRLLITQMQKLNSLQLRLHEGEVGCWIVEDLTKGKLYELSAGFKGVLECVCTFNCSFGLPCCHILFANKQRGLPLFEAKELSDRWRRGTSSVVNPTTDLEPVPDTITSGPNDSIDSSSADEDFGKSALTSLIIQSILDLISQFCFQLTLAAMGISLPKHIAYAVI